MEISVTDFSAPIGASVLKFCVQLQMLILILPSFFNFSFFPSFTLIQEGLDGGSGIHYSLKI